jgi:uncharacterized protein
MLFIIFSIDKPGAQGLRDATRAAHIEYLDRYRDKIVLGGGMLADDGAGHKGSTIIVNMKSRAEAEAFARDEPFTKAGLYATQTICRMRKGYWNPQAAPLTAQDD